MGIGDGNRCGQQAGLADPLETGGVAVAVEHVDAGETGRQTGRPRARLDDRHAGSHLFASAVGNQGAVTDTDAGYIGDGVEFAGLAKAQGDAKLTSTHNVSCRVRVSGRLG
ncbi:hypothetical protein D3C80_1880670 [compost metagenome]